MPKLTDTMQNHNMGGNFQFSATRIENLGASEYTLVVLVVDKSGSVDSFATGIEKTIKEVVKACRDPRNPRVDNLMLRVVYFDSTVQEIHGFKPIPDCNESDYNGTFLPGGSTALFDASYTGIKSAADYGKALKAKDYGVNAVVFVITDGDDNVSKVGRKKVAEALKDAKTGEALESIMTVLIGVNTDASTGLNTYLDAFKTEAGFQQYVAVDKADSKSLARLAEFVSKSISSQSQALGSGGVSQSLVF